MEQIQGEHSMTGSHTDAGGRKSRKSSVPGEHLGTEACKATCKAGTGPPMQKQHQEGARDVKTKQAAAC